MIFQILYEWASIAIIAFLDILPTVVIPALPSHTPLVFFYSIACYFVDIVLLKFLVASVVGWLIAVPTFQIIKFIYKSIPLN